MNDFGSRLRAKVISGGGAKKKVALEGVARWLESEVVPNLESKLEEAAEAGKDRVIFRHTYSNGFRPEVFEIEKLAEYQFLAGRVKHLGLLAVPMSHDRMAGMDPAVFPCFEVMVLVPNFGKDGEKSDLAGTL